MVPAPWLFGIVLDDGYDSRSNERVEEACEWMSGGRPGRGIAPEDLATCLRVLEAGGDLDPEHPDSVTLQRAVGRLFKEVNAIAAAPPATAPGRRPRGHRGHATGSADRIDDETLGLDLKPARELPAGSCPRPSTVARWIRSVSPDS